MKGIERKLIERKLNDVHNIIDENKKAQIAWYRNKKKVEEMDGEAGGGQNLLEH